MATLVTIPSVPSAPMNSCFRSYPVLSLRSVRSKSSTVPSAVTTSSLRTLPCRDPCLSSRSPPALVLTLPPIWHLPLAPRSSGTVMPWTLSSCSRASRTHPASHTTVPAAGSTASTLFMCFNPMTISSWTGTPPPTRPVLPPCGTTASPRVLQCRRISETWSVERGRSKTRESPRYFRIQSSLAASNDFASVRTLSAPRM
mmetsp:Transcript_5112/g.23015  ORF Transcript_5112/g.23015 Transcript_5112/m.23015 type:complete len:200 (-) Transcript_5112:103-702(-)